MKEGGCDSVIIPSSLGGFPRVLVAVAVGEAGTLEVRSHPRPQTHLGPEDPSAPPPSAQDVSPPPFVNGLAQPGRPPCRI